VGSSDGNGGGGLVEKVGGVAGEDMAVVKDETGRDEEGRVRSFQGHSG